LNFSFSFFGEATEKDKAEKSHKVKKSDSNVIKLNFSAPEKAAKHINGD
jgi:hypothetical protein